MSQGGQPFRVWWDDAASVARCDWADGAVCGLAEATQVTDAIRALGHESAPLLVDIRSLSSIDRAGREHFDSENGGVSAVALLAGSAVSRMIANFFIGMQRMASPTRMFTDEADAISWLASHR